MTMQHNAPPVPTKPGQQAGGNFQANAGIAGQNQQGRVQYSQQTSQNPGQTTITQTTQQWSSQNPNVQTSTQQWTSQNPGQSQSQTNKFGQESNTQQNQVNQQGTYANQQQQYTQQSSTNQSNHSQQNYQQNQQQQQRQTASINLQQQDGYNNQQSQQNQQWHQQQNLRGQQVHPSPVQRPQQQQQQGYQNGSSGMPPTASGARGAPSFLAKKHFVANQEQTEWKNKSMRKVERQSSQSFQQESQYNQADSDEDGHLPEFTSNIHDIMDLREGERAHFDCCLIPQLVGDSSLKVIWTKDGQNVQTSTAPLTFPNGTLVLDISHV